MDTTGVDLLNLVQRYYGLGEINDPKNAKWWYNKCSREGATNTRPTANQVSRKGTEMATSNHTPIKRCSKCHKEFPATTEYFYSQSRGKYGVRSRCKSCTLAENAAWEKNNPDKRRKIKKRSNANNKEKISEYNKKYRQRNLDYDKRRKKQWRENNRLHVLEYTRQYYAQNREFMLKLHQEWVKNNPDAARVNWRKRDRRLKNASGEHTVSDIQKMYIQQAGRCFYCGITLHDDYHVDHFFPLVLGGSNNPSNLVISCPPCNMSKGSKTLAEWVKVRGW